MRSEGTFVLGVVVTLVALAGGGWLYLNYGHPPVAVADAPFPMEKTIVHGPLNKRIQREMQVAPFAGSAPVYAAGAQVYAERCEFCHGGPGQDSAVGKWMYPAVPQLWKKHAKGDVVGVSDDETGETFWKVKNGIRLTGMPSFEHVLSEEQMWDVALLLKAANQPMPDAVKAELVAK